jgi:diguanylate cyclase (GGDEF)-like protein
MIVFASVIAISIAVINHIKLEKVVKDNNQFQVERIEETVTYALETIDKVYYYFDNETAAQMETVTGQLLDYYEVKPNFDEWDFPTLKKHIGFDVFIINENNVITHSTLPSDVGLDFNACCKTLAKILDDRRDSGEFFLDGMDVAQETGHVTKYSYQATRDKKYIIELGFNLEEGEVFEEFSFLQVIQKLENQYPSIQDIHVLNIGGLSLGQPAEDWELTEERKKAFKEALATEKTTEIIDKWNGEEAIYRYVPYGSNYDFGSTQNKGIEIVYSPEQLESVLKQHRESFIYQLLFIVLITILLALILSKWMARPMYLALHDVLTGLRNRTAYGEDFQNILKKNSKVALLMLDLDNFKQVNDKLRHDTGDRLLKEVGQALKLVVPKGVNVYRLGGDEFNIILPFTEQKEIERTVQKLLEAIHTTCEQFLQGEVHVTASVGIAIAPQHGEDLETLYKHADTALYASKNHGKNQYYFDA